MNFKKRFSHNSIWRIMHRMLELYKRSWQVFFPLFAVFICASVQLLIYFPSWLSLKDYKIIILFILLFFALICLVIGIITFVYDIRDARRKDKKAKAPSAYENGKSDISTF